MQYDAQPPYSLPNVLCECGCNPRETSYSDTIGKKIRSLRQARGWTQEQLAEYANLHVSYIVLLEKGTNRATIETLEKLSKAFGISISDLVQSLDEARDDPMQEQLRELLEDFVQKIDAVYRQ